MSLLGKLLGRKPFDALKAEADRLREARQYGPAKLAYERARDAKDAPLDQRAAMQSAAEGCCDALAELRLGEAQRMFEAGHGDLGFEELQHALETAASTALQLRIRDAIEAAERSQFRTEREAQAAPELDDDARYETLTGHWEMEQHAEYAGYGDAFKYAILKLNDGNAEGARVDLEAIAATADDPRYLWLELARARLAVEDEPAAIEGLERFTEKLAPDEGGDARLSAHVLLAGLRAKHDDLEGALSEYQTALSTMPEDPRVYLAMGTFLRQQDMPEEAVDVLHSGIAILEEGETNFRLWLECGLAHAAAGQTKAAIEWLERVVDYFATRQAPIPAPAAAPLAALYEQSGNLARAADLYRLLGEHAAPEETPGYLCEAARILLALGMSDEARRMLGRAREAAGEDEALTARVDALFARLA